jgi:hypothetical protein
MQPVESDVERHLDAAQSHQPAVVEGDLESVNGVGAHADTLRRSIFAAQFDGNNSPSLWMLRSAIPAGISASQARGSTSLGLGGLDQREHDGRALAAAIGAGKSGHLRAIRARRSLALNSGPSVS